MAKVSGKERAGLTQDQAKQRAADTRVFSGAINGKRNKQKLGNPRAFIKRFLEICRTATTTDDTQKLKTEVHTFVNSDLALFKLHQSAVRLQTSSADHNVDTLKQKQDELQGQIRAVEEQIRQKKDELEKSKIHKQHQEEYEQIKGMIAAFPKRSDSRAAIDKVTAEIDCLQQESRRLDSSLTLRRKQFCQLGLLLREIAGDVDASGLVQEADTVKDEESIPAVAEGLVSDNVPQPMDE